MVEPVSLTLGTIAAALVTKATEEAAGRAVKSGAGALTSLVNWLRRRFSGADEQQGVTALARVEEVPDSPSRLKELAEVLDRWAEADPEFHSELRSLVERAQASGVDVGSIAQTAWGDQNVQSAGVVSSEITVTYGQPPPAR